MLKQFLPWVRWNTPYGYRDFLRVCLPLILSTSSFVVMLLTNRAFLSHHSIESIAAALPAGLAVQSCLSFFMGLITCVSMVVAQYTGAGQPRRAGATVWQGIYIALGAGVILIILNFFAPWAFSKIGHDPKIVALEVVYFRIAIVGGVFNLLYFAMSCFFSGQGHTRVIMWVSILGMLINIPLDYFLIFGFSIGSFITVPSLGVKGAAIGTVGAWFIMFIAYCLIIFNKRWEKSHGTISQRALDWPLMKRIIRYGSPGGVQYFMETVAFTYFIFSMGRISLLDQATTNLVITIESPAFFPMLGVGSAVSILMGQAIGRGNPDDGAEVTKSGLAISSVYLLFLACIFLLIPDKLFNIFLTADKYTPEQIEYVHHYGKMMLRFVVAYCVFDGFYICCFGAIRGAGDVFFSMWIMIIGAIFFLILPLELLFYFKLSNIYSLWTTMVVYVLFLTTAAALRYKSGVWRSRRLIEKSY